MLKRIEIEQLFGLYNYDIELKRHGEEPLFITGPNGYGKSTLLNIIDYLYHENYKLLRDIPFSKLYAYFELEGAAGVVTKRLGIVRDNIEKKLTLYLADWDQKKMDESGTVFTYPGGMQPSLAFLMQQDAFYYIRDQRLYKTDRILGQKLETQSVDENARDFVEKLTALSQEIAQEVSMMDLQFTTAISEEEYQKRLAVVEEQFTPLYKYNILSKRSNLPYQKDNSMFLHAYIERLEAVIAKHAEDVKRIIAFDEIISSYEFADKELEINLKDGYRFVSRNAECTILENVTLSSGERQIMIQMYELLFRAEQDSLVLIDEPEISSHYAWQQLFLVNIQRVMALKHLQCVVATHSPLVFNGKYDELTVDLYDQTTANKTV